MDRNDSMDAAQTTVTDISVRPPLRIDQEERRRFVRLNIASPMMLQRIKDIFGKFSADGGQQIDGQILNLSACGVLIEVDQPLNEGDVVGMHFNVEGVESMDGVLGLVKRTDLGEDYHLAGIQFLSRDQLGDILSDPELELMSERFSDFDHSVRQVLGRYLYQEGN